MRITSGRPQRGSRRVMRGSCSFSALPGKRASRRRRPQPHLERRPVPERNLQRGTTPLQKGQLERRSISSLAALRSAPSSARTAAAGNRRFCRCRPERGKLSKEGFQETFREDFRGVSGTIREQTGTGRTAVPTAAVGISEFRSSKAERFLLQTAKSSPGGRSSASQRALHCYVHPVWVSLFLLFLLYLLCLFCLLYFFILFLFGRFVSSSPAFPVASGGSDLRSARFPLRFRLCRCGHPAGCMRSETRVPSRGRGTDHQRW